MKQLRDFLLFEQSLTEYVDPRNHTNYHETQIPPNLIWCCFVWVRGSCRFGRGSAALRNRLNRLMISFPLSEFSHSLTEATVRMREGFQMKPYLALGVVVLIATCTTSECHWGRRLLAQSAPSTISKYSIRWVSDPADPKRHSVEVTGLTKATLTHLRKWKLTDWQRLLRVQVEPEPKQTTTLLPAMLGTYRVAGAIRFEPVPPVPGLSYQATFGPRVAWVRGDRRDLPRTLPLRSHTRNSSYRGLSYCRCAPENLLVLSLLSAMAAGI